MPLQAEVLPSFPLIQTYLPFLIFKATFDAPPREGHQQERLDTGVGGSIADEKLDLVRIQHIAGHDQVKSFSRQTPNGRAELEVDTPGSGRHRLVADKVGKSLGLWGR